MKYRLLTNKATAKQLDETIENFRNACLWINDTVHPRVVNSVTIHFKVYQKLRSQIFSSNLTARAIARVSRIRRKAKQKNRTAVPKDFNHTIELDARTCSLVFQSWTVSLFLVGGRTQIDLDITDRQNQRLTNRRIRGVVITRHRNNYYIEFNLETLI